MIEMEEKNTVEERNDGYACSGFGSWCGVMW